MKTPTKTRKFDLRQHVDKLTKTNRKDRYVCPICEGTTLTISSKNGAYNCWSGCDTSEIREAIAPWQNWENCPPRKKIEKKRIVPEPQPLPNGKIKLARIKDYTPPQTKQDPWLPDRFRERWNIPKQGVKETIYIYSQNQWVSRYDYIKDGKPQKECIPKHRLGMDEIKWGKGDRPWRCYGYEQIASVPRDRWILGCEGEKTAETLRGVGLAAISWLGSGWSEDQLRKSIRELKASKSKGFAYFPDFDQAGIKKAKAIFDICCEESYPCLIIGLHNYDPDIEPGDDIGDIIHKKIREKNMDKSRIVTELNALVNKHKTIGSHYEDNYGDKLKKLDSRQLLDHLDRIYGQSGRLKYNELSGAIELDNEIIQIDLIYLTLAREDGLSVTKTLASDTMIEVARNHSYHPVKRYLEAVEKNTKPISISNLSSRYFGTKSPIYNKFIEKTLIAAVARAFKPGCKHDTTLVLQGKQGVGKSTFFETLGGDWFDSSMQGCQSKDDLLILHSAWIEEWGEIERVFGKRQSGEIKAFLSRGTDQFRRPYDRASQAYQRSSIIVGSVNESDFLVDSTGNRRYWVIPIQCDKIDLKLLKKERDQIWAKAVELYRSGSAWWLSAEEDQLNQRNNIKFEIQDEWQPRILEFLRNQRETTVSELLIDCLDFLPREVDRKNQCRVANILKKLGGKKLGQKRYKGKNSVVWRLPEAQDIPDPISIGKTQNPETLTPQSFPPLNTPHIPKPENKSKRGENTILPATAFNKISAATEKVYEVYEGSEATALPGIEPAYSEGDSVRYVGTRCKSYEKLSLTIKRIIKNPLSTCSYICNTNSSLGVTPELKEDELKPLP